MASSMRSHASYIIFVVFGSASGTAITGRATVANTAELVRSLLEQPAHAWTGTRPVVPYPKLQ